MPAIFRYFWFLFAAFMTANLLIWRRRLAIVVERGNATRTEVDAFQRWVAVWILGAPLVIGAISLAAGWSSPFCAGVLSVSSVPQALVSAIFVAAWATLLLWVWRGAGAEFLGRVAPALSQRPSYDKRYAPGTVRAFVTISVIVCAAFPAIMWRTMPDIASNACPTSTPTSTASR